MTTHKISTWLVAGLLLSMTSTVARGQQVNAWVNTPAHDLQLFSPVDFDFDNRPIRRDSGYSFRYDKLNWAFVGEHTTIGDNNLLVFSDVIFPPNPNDLGTPPPPYEIINGLQEVPPDAAFAWGERYELGYFDGSSGWSVGILDGLQANSRATYGLGEGSSASVHVNFVVPPSFLFGFRNNLLPFQITYDLNGNGIAGYGGFDTTIPPDDVIDPPFFYDFGDLALFNVSFNTVDVRNVTETQGIEIMKTHRLTNDHKMAKHQGRNLDIAYGVRFLRLRDAFSFEGNGGLLGRTFADTRAENQIVGPQIRAKWSSQRGRWNLGVDGRFVFGCNVQDLDQVGAIGANLRPDNLIILVPGTPMVPGTPTLVSGAPTAFSYGRQENDFSPLAELRADLSYQVTGSIAARLGYTAIFVDNITRASQMVRWELPDMGLLPGSGNQEIFINGVNFGFDVVY